MTKGDLDHCTSPRDNREPAKWLFTYAVVAFVTAMVVIGVCAVRLSRAKGFPSGDGLLAFYVLLQVTVVHSLFNLFLAAGLLILRRWRLAAVAFAFGLVAAAPLAILFLSE
jgi:hypothetical protein